jgi:hypothetical protein
VTGIHTSNWILESLVGFIDPATRHAAVSIGGVAPGGSNVPAGTTEATLIVVSGRERVARLSHDAGAAIAAAEESEPVANITNAGIAIA